MQKCEWINLIDGRGQNHKAMQVTSGLAIVSRPEIGLRKR